MSRRRDEFYSLLFEQENSKSSNTSGLMKKEEYDEIVSRLTDFEDPETKEKKTQKDYRLIKKFELMETSSDEGEDKVLQLVKRDSTLKYVCAEELYDTIRATHIATGHGGRNIVYKTMSGVYANITLSQITLFLQHCDQCQQKRSAVRRGGNGKTSSIIKPKINSIISTDMNSLCQVDIIDMQRQRDGSYQYILNYQDHLTKFVSLRPLQSKSAEEVAHYLIDIFCDKGAPLVLQTNNGVDFSEELTDKIRILWPWCKLVPHSQSQGSVVRANKDIKAMLLAWQKDNNTSRWSEGLRVIQWQKNIRYHTGIGRSPYEAMFGQKPHLEITTSNLPDEEQIESGKDRLLKRQQHYLDNPALNSAPMSAPSKQFKPHDSLMPPTSLLDNRFTDFATNTRNVNTMEGSGWEQSMGF